MLGAQNDLGLHLRREANEIIAVAADTDDKIGISFGMLAGREQRFAIDNVDLQLKAAAADIGLDQGDDLGNRLAVKMLFGKLDIDGNAADELLV